MPRQRVNDEIALDLRDRVPDQLRDRSFVFHFADPRPMVSVLGVRPNTDMSRHRDGFYRACGLHHGRACDVKMGVILVIRRAGLGR